MNRMSHNDDRRRAFMQQPVPTAGPVLLGQQPTKEQIQEMNQAMLDKHLMAVSQAIFNQVVSHMLATMDSHQQLTHEKMLWLAQQCRGASPYVAMSFGMLTLTEQQLPSEATDSH